VRTFGNGFEPDKPRGRPAEDTLLNDVPALVPEVMDLLGVLSNAFGDIHYPDPLLARVPAGVRV
jgi:hypothetical protein